MRVWCSTKFLNIMMKLTGLRNFQSLAKSSLRAPAICRRKISESAGFAGRVVNYDAVTQQHIKEPY